jgi:hypothetical protein
MHTTPNGPSPARTLTWVVAIAAIGFGLLAALVGAIQTQRTCFGFDDFCDGPHVGNAALAFGSSIVLVTIGVVLVVQLRRRRPAAVPPPPETETEG